MPPKPVLKAKIAPNNCQLRRQSSAVAELKSRSTPAPYLEEILKIAKFEPGTYEVVQSFEPPKKK